MAIEVMLAADDMVAVVGANRAWEAGGAWSGAHAR